MPSKRSTRCWPGTSCSKAEDTEAPKLSRGMKPKCPTFRPHPPGSSWWAQGWTGASHRRWPRGCGPRCCSHLPQGEEEGLLPFWEKGRPGRGTAGRQQVHRDFVSCPSLHTGASGQGKCPTGKVWKLALPKGEDVASLDGGGKGVLDLEVLCN